MKQRVILLFIAFTATGLMLAMLLIYLLFISTTVEIVEQRGADDIQEIAADISAAVLPVDFQKIAGNFAAHKNIHIIIVDLDSNLLADTYRGERPQGKYINANLSAARKGSITSSLYRNRKSNTMDIAVGNLVDSPGGSLVISCVYPLTSFFTLTRGFILYSLLTGLLLGILVLLLTRFYLKRYQRPITNLLQHTRNATDVPGQFGKISVVTANRELKELVGNFNTLIDNYNLIIASDNSKYSKINSLLSHIRTGIMIVDPDNSITLINPRAEQLLNVDKALLFSGRTGEMTANRALQTVLALSRLVNDDKVNRSDMLILDNGLELELHLEAMYSKYTPYLHNGTLVLIRDVTEIRRMERLKDEFISNVSHELRTPLTVINGFVQTLQSWDALQEEDRRTSLTIIELETERLKKLISELLILSRIEGEMDISNMETFSARRVLEEAMLTLSAVAARKSISLSCRVLPERITLLLRGREIWFKQIISNLVDNAIKYSPEASSVGITLCKEDDMVVLTVTDTGIGIPEEDVPRIFERFYRVEKSRNSRIAGSGLGLAITRLMVEEFGGTIAVASRVGVGTEIVVRLPAAAGGSVSEAGGEDE